MHVVAESLELSFGQRAVHRGLDLHVRSGESVAITGPSGSGKSTLLAVLGGQILPDVGSVTLSPTAGRRAVSWVFQTTNIIPRRTVLDNVIIGAYGVCAAPERARARALDALERVGIIDLADVRSADVSGGERQRTVVARCIVGRPGLILADEPTGQLDRESSQLVIRSLIEDRSSGTSVIVATHDPATAATCGRQLLLEGGRLHEQ